MTRTELNHLKMDVYKNYIQLHYGNEIYNKVEVALKNNIHDKDFEVRSKDFENKLTNIDIEC